MRPGTAQRRELRLLAVYLNVYDDWANVERTARRVGSEFRLVMECDSCGRLSVQHWTAAGPVGPLMPPKTPLHQQSIW